MEEEGHIVREFVQIKRHFPIGCQAKVTASYDVLQIKL